MLPSLPFAATISHVSMETKAQQLKLCPFINFFCPKAGHELPCMLSSLNPAKFMFIRKGKAGISNLENLQANIYK